MIDVVMPQMGESIVEGTLTKWLKKTGDRVERDEPLFEISTDKVDTEIPAPASGVVAATLVDEGKTVAINTVVARIDESGGGQVSAPSKAAAAPQPPPTVGVGTVPEPTPGPRPEPGPTPQPSPEPPGPQPQPPQPTVPPGGPEPEPMQAGTDGGQGPLSPLVRRMARENNIDLRQVKGTGAGGRITRQDVENFLAHRQRTPVAAPPAEARAAQPQPAAPPPAPPQVIPPQPPPPARPQPAAAQPMPAPPPIAPEMPPAAPQPPPAPRAEAAKVRVEPMSMMRSRIAEHMVASKHISPHVTTVHKIDMTRVAKMRARNKEEVQARYGYSLTYLPFVSRAAAEALRAYPLCNASIEGSNILYHNDINIGIAVALENGLIVPVIRNADEKNVLGLQRAIVDLATRARSRQLKPDEVQGGTFSITNFGSFGSLFGTPIINQPQVAILGVGAVQKEPVVTDDDAIAIRHTSYIGLTFDHRLVDGAYADQFMTRLKHVLENWSEEVL